MDGAWRDKCSSATWTSPPSLPPPSSSPAPPPPPTSASSSANQMNKNFRNLPAAQEPQFSRTLNLDFTKSGKTELNNSFLALLSSNPHHLPGEFSQLAKNHAHNVSLGAQVSGISPLSHDSASGIVRTAKNPFLGDMKDPALCSSLQVAASHCQDQVFQVNTSPNNPLNIQTAQSFGYGHDAAHSRGRPRVICMRTVGELFLNELGLLGVICFCHGLPMSVGKFCEHSGSKANPGEAVRLENGITIARWRKLCFGNNAPDDRKGWEWSYSPSTTNGFIQSRDGTLPRLPQNPGTVDSVQTFVGLNKSGDHWNKFLCTMPPNPGFHQAVKRNSTAKVSDDMCQRNISKGDGFANPSQNHVTALAKNHTVLGPNRSPENWNPGASRLTANREEQNAWSRLVTARDNCKEKLGTSSLLCQHPGAKPQSCEHDTNKFSFGNEALEVPRGIHSSNIDLQLGQPSQAPPILSSLSTSINSQQFGVVCNHQKSQTEFPLTDKTAYSLETKQPKIGLWRTSLQPPVSNRRQSENAVGSSRNSNNHEPNELIVNETRSSLISMFLSHLNTERSTVFNDNKHSMLDLTSSKCNLSECVNDTKGGKERNNFLHGSGLSSNRDKRKCLINFGSGSYDTVKSNYTVHNKDAVDTRVLPPVSAGQCLYGGSSADGRTISSQFSHLSSIMQKRHDLIDFNQYEKIPSVRNNDLCTSATNIPMNVVSHGAVRPCHLNSRPGAPVNLNSSSSWHISKISSAPVYTQDAGHTPQDSDNNMKTLAFRHMVELPKQEQSAATFEVNPRHQRLCCHSGIKLQKNVYEDDSAALEDRGQRICDIRQNASDFTVVPLQSYSNCFSCNGAEMLACKCGTRGQNGYCKCTTLRISSSSKEQDVSTHHLCCADDHPCLRFVRMPNYGFEPSGVANKIFDRKEQTACCCSMLSKHLRGCCFAGNFSFSDSSNKQNACGKRIIDHRNQVCHEIHMTPDIKGVDLCECTNKRFILRNDCQAGLWRDVPAKKTGHSDATSVDKPAEVPIRLPETTDKRFEETQEEFDTANEQQMSNVCSISSAPALTEISVEVNKASCCATDVEDNKIAYDSVADVGSGVEKCGSSDEALDARECEEDPAVNCKVDRDKYGYSLPCQSSGDPINEIRLETSSDRKRAKILAHGQSTNQENIKKRKVLTSENRKEQMKMKRLSMPYSESHCFTHLKRDFSSLDRTNAPSQSETMLQRSSIKRKCSSLSSTEPLSLKTKIHHNVLESDKLQSTDNDQFLRPSAISSGQEERNVHVGKEFTEQKAIHLDSEKPPRYMSLNHIAKSNNHEMEVASKKAWPVVCGRSGIISSGELNGQRKPPKFISLSLILERSKRCDVNECGLESRSSSASGTDNGCCKELSFSNIKGENKDSKIDDEDPSSVCMFDTNNQCSSDSDDDVDEFSKMENVKDGGDDKGKLPVLCRESKSFTRPRYREVRKCSLSKLLEEDKQETRHSAMFRTEDQSTKVVSTKDAVLEGKSLDNKDHEGEPGQINTRPGKVQECQPSFVNSDALCCVCGTSNKEDFNCILECNHCSIKVHQACYGVSKAPRGRWFCRPCKSNSLNTVCVLCGYGSGAMTKAVKSQNIVKSLLKAWNFGLFMKSLCSSEIVKGESVEGCLIIEASKSDRSGSVTAVRSACSEAYLETATGFISTNQTSDMMPKEMQLYNSVTAGVLDPSVTQWVHMVCGLWTPGTRCPNVDTMNAFDVSGASTARKSIVCSMCNRPGGCCIQCRVLKCAIYFHPWCAHQKGLLQGEAEGDGNEKVGFYGRCMLHAAEVSIHADSNPRGTEVESPKDWSCARTEGFKGRKSKEGFKFNHQRPNHDNGGCIVSQEQINAWLYIQKSCTRAVARPPTSDIEHDFRKEYFRYKQSKAWKHFVVYKSGIHALGLYTSQLIARGAMVVEYVGEIVGLRVADKREIEYQSGRRLQYKSACYFFRIDKEHIIDATCKGGIARFVNHSCEPNCVAKVIPVRNEKKVVFFAERDINPGEEITYDYHFNSEDEGQKIPCYCNSNNCRRFLN